LILKQKILLTLSSEKEAMASYITAAKRSLVLGTVNGARFLLSFYRLKKKEPSAQDKEKNRKNT